MSCLDLDPSRKGFSFEDDPGLHRLVVPDNLTVPFGLDTTSVIQNKDTLPLGSPTSTLDTEGRRIRLGDKVELGGSGYEHQFTDYFVVVFENNAFRKEYPGWDKTLAKPLLEWGENAKALKFKIVKTWFDLLTQKP